MKLKIQKSETIQAWIKTLTPLLIALFTVFIGNYCVIQPFQEKQWKEKNKLERKNAKQKEALKYFEYLSDHMDKRLWLTREYFWAIKNQSQNMQKKHKDLRNFLSEWNIQLNKNIVKTAVYFHSQKTYRFDFTKCTEHCKETDKMLCECQDPVRTNCLKNPNGKSATEIEWECNIHYNFRCIYLNTLKDYKNNPSDEKLKKTTGHHLDCLNQRIEQFNRHILQTVFPGEI